MKLWQKEQEGVLMVNKEKVVRGLKCCASMDANACNKCMYIGCSPDRYCFGNLAADALALLKGQEPRVMTLEEAKAAYVIEYRSGKMREVGARLLDIDIDPANGYYGDIYRVWTSRPTKAEREATPWTS